MGESRKFVFSADFRNDGRKAVSEAEVEAARMAGFQAGQVQAQSQMQAQMGALLTQLVRGADMLLARQDERLAQIEAEAAHLAAVTARALAGGALADKPLSQLSGAARECLAHARSAPHLLIRVHESLVEEVETMMAGLIRESGFAGRLVVLGEPDIVPGDGRIEWADGGVVIDRSRTDEAVEAAMVAVFGRAGASAPAGG